MIQIIIIMEVDVAQQMSSIHGTLDSVVDESSDVQLH